MAASSTSYTQNLWVGTSTSSVTQSATVGTGLLWVIRNISVATPGLTFSNALGFAIADNAGHVIFGRTGAECAGSMWYYYEGRFVIAAGGYIQFVPGQASFQFAITGFVFHVP